MSAPSLKRYRVAIAQELIHSIVVEAYDEDAAAEIAFERYRSDPDVLVYSPPEPWDLDCNKPDIDACDLIDDEHAEGKGGAQ
jgi:hypothetical protein